VKRKERKGLGLYKIKSPREKTFMSFVQKDLCQSQLINIVQLNVLSRPLE